MAWCCPMRRWFRVLWCLMAAAILAALPLMILEFKRAQFSVRYQAWFIAGIFVLLALPVTIYEVALHLEYYSRPHLQIHVIRILWMVPIYALDSWLALRFSASRPYLDAIRECYEAYVLYNFYMFLIAYLEEEYGDIEAYFSTKEPIPHEWPFKYCLRPWNMGSEFFWQCKKGVLSYVILRPLMTLVGFLTEIFGKFCDGQLRFDCAYIYTAIVNNASQIWALYCLVLFYKATREELQPIRPLSKFVVIKAVIFFSYWQSVAIAILVRAGVLKKQTYATYDVDEVAGGLQEFLICIEMFFAALAHAYAFPPRDYRDPAAPPAHGFAHNVKHMFQVQDVVDDVQDVVDETYQNTQENIAHVGRKTWATAKRTTNNITEAPRTLLMMFGRNKRSRLHGESSVLSDDEESANQRPLLQYSASDGLQNESPTRSGALRRADSGPV
ncbi:hypothetical protein WJX72_008269 [[Myrmecia] bisecta]|uniref:Transmembrane protein 184C n=1 Tax=[Myrmecia] bisecta TaxID=41462 RepID=A0AAW1PDT6_9CHLO